MRFYVPTDDPKIPQVISVLELHGLKMRPNAYVPAEREFIDIIHRREFEETDFESAKYLNVRASVSICHRNERTQDGSLRVYMDDINRRFRMASVSDQIVVTDSVREEFEEQRFEHLAFRRCVVAGAENLEDFSIWEVTSDLVLPPFSPGCKLCDSYGGNDYTNPEKGLAINDGLHLPTQYRYRAKDLLSVEPFDAAQTREAVGFGHIHHPLIVSQRFYQFCKKQKFKLWWYPVVLDQD